MHAQTSELINTLMKMIEELKGELIMADNKINELEGRLVLYQETGAANISRNTFRNYVISAINRRETDQEWRRFMSEFNHDSSSLNSKIYAWIDANITTEH